MFFYEKIDVAYNGVIRMTDDSKGEIVWDLSKQEQVRLAEFWLINGKNILCAKRSLRIFWQ